MKNKRPVNLDLRTIKFPLPAIASILHRVSGFILFFFIPLLLWLLHQSLASAQSFDSIATCLSNPILKVILWGFLAALLYHLAAGIRHLIMDFGIGETLPGGRRGALIVFIVAVVLIVLAGWWLW
jgi:succinate dehydrogenase / fumarate reductase cytochrome b subunit